MPKTAILKVIKHSKQVVQSIYNIVQHTKMPRTAILKAIKLYMAVQYI
jgi:hypothetical protein